MYYVFTSTIKEDLRASNTILIIIGYILTELDDPTQYIFMKTLVGCFQ